MNNNFFLILAFIAGTALGIFFFGVLWFTVKKLVQSKRPALWFLGSLILRVGITLTGFYFIAHGSWQRMLVCLLGFITARFIVIRLTMDNKKQLPIHKETFHEA
jgi:F1F0 ATPase subunit 2